MNIGDNFKKIIVVKDNKRSWMTEEGILIIGLKVVIKMGKRVPYGRVDLKSVREDGLLYIDETMYIEKLEQNNVLIYTRTRRFGKSMLTSMLAYYYSANEQKTLMK